MVGDDTPPTKLLLVEGSDDEHVVEHLRQRLASDIAFQYETKEGIDPLLESIDVEITVDGRLALGIMIDANDDLAARWDAISHRLRKANVEPPAQPERGGTVIDGDPRVGVWLMPDNSTRGELENFVAELIPEDDPIWPLAEQYIDGIPREHRQVMDGKELRAKIHAWLATRSRPRWMGTAIRAKDLDAGVPLAGELAEWLRKLFGP